MKKAAIYLRSSKDRSDVSISSQRRELTKLAADRNFLIIKEYSDVVESAKDEHRPGFQKLLYELKSTNRAWGTLIITEHTRLARNQFIAQIFKHEASKLGVEIMYAIAPDLDPISKLMLDSFMEANAQVHSMLSKQKGLGGMRENVMRGFRAGGRAPRGYKLDAIATGAMREGKNVTKSKLIPSNDAPVVQRYLKARAEGVPRSRVTNNLNVPWPQSTLIGMEWNALTYAGHTVWNVHNEFDKTHGYKGGVKRRPRSEWVVNHNTHEALITDDEAEAILARLDQSSISKARRTKAKYLLSGILKTPNDESWYGDMGSKYRIKPKTGKGRYIPADKLEAGVIQKIRADFMSADTVDNLIREVKKHKERMAGDPANELRKKVTAINGQISKVMDLVVALTDPGPALRKVDELEAARKTMVDEIQRIEQEHVSAAMLDKIDRTYIRDLLDDLISDLQSQDREEIKDRLFLMIEKVTLCPQTLECKVFYKIPVIHRNKMASPRGFNAIPVLKFIGLGKLVA